MLIEWTSWLICYEVKCFIFRHYKNITQIKNIVTYKKNKIVHTNFLTCLKDAAQQWYSNEFNEQNKITLRIDINQWYTAFVKYFHENFMIHVSENNHQFSSFTHSVRTDCEEWSWWNSFIKTDASFFIIMYSSHVLLSYSSHLIRSSNCASWICYLMLSIELIKYRSSSLSTVMSSSSDICCSIRSCFENSNKLTWNIKCIFISSNKLNSYT